MTTDPERPRPIKSVALPAQRASVPATTLLRGFFQLGYVTTDIDEAVDYFSVMTGVSRFLHFRGFRGVDALGNEGVINMALAKTGGHEIELIQPLDRKFGFLSDPLPAQGFALRFHHVGMLVDSKQELEATMLAAQRRGLRIPSYGSFQGLVHYLFVDTRAELGHSLEYNYRNAAANAMFAGVPSN
jgi:hypothetical protein